MSYDIILNFIGDSIVEFSELCSYNPNVSFLGLGIGLILFSWLLAFLGKR